jgi:hypothetical protein
LVAVVKLFYKCDRFLAWNGKKPHSNHAEIEGCFSNKRNSAQHCGMVFNQFCGTLSNHVLNRRLL